MKVFISDIDTPVGHNLSRLLANTIVGSRKKSEGDDDGGAEEKLQPTEPRATACYQVIGTLCYTADCDAELPPELMTDGMDPVGKKKETRTLMQKISKKGKHGDWVKEVIPKIDTDKVKEQILEADVVIFDLLHSVEQANWAFETVFPENIEKFIDKPKIVIAVSSVMTWAKTKSDPDDPETSFAEDDYRKRRTHPNFRPHLAAEKALNKLGRNEEFKTYVVAQGLCYHIGDSIFHHILQAAWSGQPEVIVYGEGDNYLPTIHLDDLCKILLEAIETTPDYRYIVAIDDSKHTYLEIATAISEALGTGKVKKVQKEQALICKDFTQMDYDMLLLNLKLEVGHIKEMALEWKSETGLIENIATLVQEYKIGRGLTPLKIVIHGPPASGKSTLAKRLAEYYQIHLIEVDAVVKETISRLERRVHGTVNGVPVTEEPGKDEERSSEEEKELLEELLEAAKNNNGNYPGEYVLDFLKAKIRSMSCRNQGYVLDGYPTTIEEANQLFKPGDEADQKEDDAQTVDQSIPEFVISLEASDEFIKDRLMRLSESEIAGTRNSEEALTRRLEEYRAKWNEENTVLNYFDELEKHPFVINIESFSVGDNADALIPLTAGPVNEKLMQKLIKFVGKPHNYGLSGEEILMMKKMKEEEKSQLAQAALQEQKKREEEEFERHNQVMAEWNIRLDEVRKQEQEVLEAQSVPLRNYLMKHVMPTLTTGLIEVCKVRPDDPIDYLAEYLFRYNSGQSK